MTDTAGVAATVDRPSPTVTIESGPAFELVAELAAFASGPARASLESGKTWIRDVRRLAGADLIRRVERWAFPLYTELAPIVLEVGPPFEPADLVKALRRHDADRLRQRLLGMESPPNISMLSDGAFGRALSGNARARAEIRRTLGLNPPARQSLDRLFRTSPRALQDEIASIVQDWGTRVSRTYAQRAAALVARDVQAKTVLFRNAPVGEALRVSTNGVEFDLEGWATDIALIPTVALRPFIAPVESGSTQLILCSVADEAFDDDPAAPPRRLVKVTTALGDEVRLRILHELAGEDLTASELAARLGVERTSLHHHLGVLRSAGLVAARAEGVQSWRYARRTDGITDVASALSRYLDPIG
jgi:DNA-binding transcriptional ArsR family regulator